ncbi:MAG: Gfo/Idh/MocA family oxidoreductase [Sulfolobales archaeon]
MDKVRMGFIGAGFIADVLARTLLQLNEYASIEAVFSREIEKAKHFARRYGIKNVYRDWRDIAGSKEIDAVIIATPDYTHKEIAVECARNGKHIYLEKPIALRLRDAREIIDAASRNNVKLFVGHCLRYWPEYVKVREAVYRGDIGEPRIARAYRLGSFPRPLWYGYMEYSGGVVVDMAIHDIDFLRWVLGPVRRVYGVGGRYTKNTVDAIDHAIYVLEFESGTIAYGEASWAMPGSFRFTTYLEIAGTKGLLRVDNRSNVSVTKYLENSSSSYAPIYRDAFYNELRAFLRWILFGDPVTITPEDALESLRVALAINRSIEKGEIIDLKEAILE